FTPTTPAKESARPVPAANEAAAPASAFAASGSAPANPTRVVAGVTETIESPNPYAHTDSLKFGIWSEAYGTLIRQDFEKGHYVGVLAESWTVENPTTWVF